MDKIYEKYLQENATIKLTSTPYGKVRVIYGYKGYNKLYIIKKGKMGYYVYKSFIN
jgi:hypothetical protein